jgi:hypothetical protein
MEEITKDEAHILLTSDEELISEWKNHELGLEPFFRLQPGDKLGFHQGTLQIYKKSMFQGILRWYFDENRFNTYIAVKTIVRNYKDFIQKHSSSINVKELHRKNERIIKALEYMTLIYNKSLFISKEYLELAESLRHCQ